MADLGPAYPGDWDGAPAGMLPRDVPTWKKFARSHGPGFLNWYFNVRVGTVSQVDDPDSAAYVKMWSDINRKRIDALGVRADSIWIVEVSEDPSNSALGQLMLYVALFAEETDDPRPLIPVLVAQRIDADLARVCAAQGIVVELV